jgi:hypothetical protein
LHGHAFGDHVHEYLAPCIYEGEGEMLSMAFFKSLVKHHGTMYFEPIGKALAAAGIRKPNPLNPAHAWALKGAVLPYAKWMLAQRLSLPSTPVFPEMPASLKEHAEFAVDRLQALALEISNTMSKHQLALADRQCRMSELSLRVQDTVTILVTALYGARQPNEVLQQSADILCQDLTRKLTGKRPSDRYFRAVTKLGKTIADGGFPGLSDVPQDKILMTYSAT